MFYNQLKQACKENGTSITAVLKKIGIGTANGTYWKNGSIPSSDIVVQLSEFLNVSTDYLLKGVDSSAQQLCLPENEQELTDIEEKLLRDFRSLSQQGQDYIRQQMFIAREVYKNDNLPQSNLNAG